MAYNELSIFKEPVCLIYSDDNRHLCIKEEVLKEIGSLNQTFHIVTITGLCRTGKSYLMNRLADVRKAFPLGSSIESQTKGIWVLCRAHPEYKNDILILMDTEGLGDIEKGDMNHDNCILALAVLLSSTLIYNILGTMRDNDLQMLSYVAEVCRQIATAEDKAGVDVDDFCPMLVLTLRDFSLELKKDGSSITTDIYLNDFCLKTLQGSGEKERSYNETRQCIEKYFKRRKCFTFDRPGDRTTLQNLETKEDSELSADFIRDSKQFVEYVLKQHHPKRLDPEHSLTGSSFVTLINKYVDVIRNGRIPNVQNVLSATLETENKKAVEDCCALYISGMEILRLPTPDEQALSVYHQQCMKKALDLFLTKCIRDERKKFYEEANRKIEEEYKRYSLKNDVESEKCCKQSLCQLYNIMQNKLNDNVYLCSGGFKEYEIDLMTLKEKYKCQNDLGCKKMETLQTFLDQKQIEREMIKQADQTMTDKESKLEEAINREKASHEQLQDMTNQLCELNKELNEQECTYKAQLDQMQKTIKEINERKETEIKVLQDKFHNKLAKEKLAFDEQLLKETDNLKQLLKEKEERIALLNFTEKQSLQLQKELKEIQDLMHSTKENYDLLLRNEKSLNEELKREREITQENYNKDKDRFERQQNETKDALEKVRKENERTQYDLESFKETNVQLNKSLDALKIENNQHQQKILNYETGKEKLPIQNPRWCSLQ